MYLHIASKRLVGCLNRTCLPGSTIVGRLEETRSYTPFLGNRPDPRPLLILRACHSSVAYAHPTPFIAARFISSSTPRHFEDLNNDTLVNLVSLHHFEAAQRLHDHLATSGITIQPHPIYVDAALAALDRPSHTERINLFSTWFRLVPDVHVSLSSSSPSDDASTSPTASKEASHTSQVVDLRPIHNALLHNGTPANNLPLISRFAALAAEKGYTIPQLASATGDSAQVAHARIWPDILALLISHAPPALATKIMVEHEFAVGAYVARMGNAHAPAERARLREQSVRACLDAARLRGDVTGVRSKGNQTDVKGKRTDWSTANAGWLDAAAALLRTADGLKLDRRLFDNVIAAHVSRGASDTSGGSSNSSGGSANDNASSNATLSALRTARAAHGRKARTEARLALPGDLPMQLREVRAAVRERVLHTYLDVNDFLVRLCRARVWSAPRIGTRASSILLTGASNHSYATSSSTNNASCPTRLLALLRRRALAHSDATALTWLVAELYLCRHVMDGRRALGIFLENFTMEGFGEEARGLIKEVARVHGIKKDDAKVEGEVESHKKMVEGRKRQLPPPFIPGTDPAVPKASTPSPSPQTSTAAGSPTTAALSRPIALPPHHHWLIWHALTLLAWKHPPRLRRLLDAYEASVVGSEAETHDGASQAVVRAHSSEALAAGGARQVLLGFMSGFARHGIARSGSAMHSGRGRGQGNSSTSLADLRRVWRLMERLKITPRRAHYEILAKSVALAGEGSERGGAPSQSAHDPRLSVGVSAALDILEHIPHPESYAAVIDALLDRGMVGAEWKVREAMEGRFGKDMANGRSPRLRATMTRLDRMTEEKVAAFAAQRKRHTGGMKARTKTSGKPPVVNKPSP